MKAKLIKKDEHYFLEVQPCTLSTSQKHTIIANTFDKPKGDILQLSLKNCEAIELGYDLDELADEYCNKIPFTLYEQEIFKDGFQKALEILGDKKFSKDDMIQAYNQGTNDGAGYEGMCDYDTGNCTEAEEFSKEAQEEFIQSLQQTEWDCIVEMECCGNYNPPCNINCGYGPKQKLDADGCLILRKI